MSRYSRNYNLLDPLLLMLIVDDRNERKTVDRETTIMSAERKGEVFDQRDEKETCR